MTNADSRFDRIEAILERVAIQQAELSNKQNIAQDQIITLESALVELANRQANTQEKLDELLTTATNIFNRDAVRELPTLTLRYSVGFQLHGGLPRLRLASASWTYIPSTGRVPRPRGL